MIDPSTFGAQSADAHHSALPVRGVRQRLRAMYWIAVLGIVGLAAWMVRGDFTDRVRDGAQEVALVALTTETNLYYQIDRADQVLARLAMEAVDMTGDRAVDVAVIDRMLQHRGTVNRPVFVLGLDGEQHIVPAGATLPPAVVERVLQQVRGTVGDASSIVPMSMRAYEGQLFVPMVYPIRRADGSPGGVVGILLVFQDIDQVHRELRLHGVDVRLLHDGGVTLAQLGDPLPSSPAGDEIERLVIEGATVVRRSHTLSLERRLGNWPLRIAVSMPTDGVYAAWRRHALLIAAIVALVLLLSGGLMRMLLAQLRRIEADAEDLEIARFTLSQTSDVVYWVDAAGRFAFANPAVERLFGVSSERMIGMTMRDIFPDVSRERFERDFAHMRERGEAQFPTEYRGPDGESKPAEVRCRHIRYRGVEYACVVMRDLGERLATERAQREGRERFEAAAAGAEVGIWEWNARTDRIWRSPLHVQLMGGNAAMLPATGKAYAATFDSVEIERLRSLVDDAIRTRGRIVFERPHTLPDGSTRWLRISGAPRFDAAGQLLGIAGSLIDVTETKRIELELRANSARQEIIFQRSPLGIIVSRKSSGEVLDVNDTALRMTGIARERFVGRTTVELGFWPDTESRARDLPDEGEQYVGELPYTRADGEIIELMRISHPIELDGELCYITTLQDVTARNRMEAEREAALVSLKRAERMARIGNWSCDLRTNRLIWSDEIYRIHEVDPARTDLSYDDFIRLVHPDDRARVDEVYRKSVVSHRPYHIVLRQLFPDGRIKYLEDNGNTLFADDGTPLVTYGTTQDVTERKLAEMTREIALENLQRAERIAKIGNWSFDLRTHQLTWSDEAYRIHEADPATFVPTYEKFFELVHPEDRNRVRESYQESLAQRSTIYEVAHRLQFADGRIKYVEQHGRTQFDENGVPILSRGTVQDVTERAEAEAARRTVMESLQRAERIAKVGNWSCDMRTNQLTWSDEVWRIHEVDPLTFVPTYEGFLELVHPDDRSLVDTTYKRSLALKQPFGVVHRQQFADGRVKYLEEHGETTFDDDGTPLVSRGTVQDVTARKLIEIELTASRERQMRIIQSSPTAMSISDPDSRVLLDVNGAWLQMFGFELDEVVGRDVIELGVWVDPAMRAAQIDAIRRGESARDLDGRFVRADGEHLEARCSFELLELDGDSVLLVTFVDVTEQRRAERVLVRQGQLLRQTGAVARVGGWEFDPLTGVMTWSEELYRILECESGSEASLDRLLTACGEVSRQVLEQTVERAIVDGGSFDVEFPFATAHGNARWAHMRGAAEVREGHVMRLYGALQDVTERYLHGEWLRESEARFARMFDSAPVGIILFRTGNRVILDVNPAMCHIGGFARAQVIGMTVEQIKPLFATDLFDFAAADVEGSGANRDATAAFWYRRADGCAGYVSTSSSMFEYGGERLVIVFLVDVTGQQQAAREIRHLNETLEQRVHERTAQLEVANRELESFSYSVSHDLRAPLRAITGFSTILLSEHASALNEDGRALLQRVVGAGERMAQLIDALLDLARVMRQSMQRTEVDLSALAEAVMQELREADPARAAEVHIEPDMRANGDPALLRGLLQNLLGNAWKYSAKKPLTRIIVSSRIEAGGRVYSVRDEGAGFDMRYAGRLFGAFQRLHSDKDFEGTGVGLSVVERIVLRHGGRIWAEAEPGNGATFHFTLG